MSKKHKKSYSSHISWVIGILVVGGLAYLAVTAPRISGGELVSSAGIHYHPKLSITILGKPVQVENNVGLGAVHKPIHTHEEGDGTLHLEFEGVVKKTDTRLGIFFDHWGKEWTDSSFMGNPLGNGRTLTMKVDGVVSTEGRNLLMKDGQKIELIYEAVEK